jgi:hypothetical protein
MAETRYLIARTLDGTIQASIKDGAPGRLDARAWMMKGLVIDVATQSQLDGAGSTSFRPIGRVLTPSQAIRFVSSYPGIEEDIFREEEELIRPLASMIESAYLGGWSAHELQSRMDAVQKVLQTALSTSDPATKGLFIDGEVALRVRVEPIGFGIERNKVVVQALMPESAQWQTEYTYPDDDEGLDLALETARDWYPLPAQHARAQESMYEEMRAA